MNTPSGTHHTKTIPEGEDQKSGTEKIFKEIIIKTFPNLEKDRPTGSRRVNSKQDKFK